MHETNEPITRTRRKGTEKRKTNERYKQTKRTKNASETNEKRKRYEIYVNINDPGSVYCIEPHCCYLHEI